MSGESHHNPGQNVWENVKKVSKIGQGQNIFIYAFS